MNKCRLNLDAIVVESFEVSSAGLFRGTVRGQMPTYDASCSCDIDCGSGYGYSCNPSFCPGSACPIYCDTAELCGGGSQFNTCADTCSPCEHSVNNVNTCVAPCPPTRNGCE